MTPAQRHVFRKALKALEGADASLAPEIRSDWALAVEKGKPADRARVINATIDRKVTYANTFSAKKLDLKKYNKLTASANSKHSAHGRTRTAMGVAWGHGDLARGAAAVNLGLQRGHLQERNGLIFEVSHTIDIQRGEEQCVAGEAAASSCEFDMMQGEVKKHLGWLSWAEAKQHADGKTRPPSADAKSHIETAVGMVSVTMDEFKKQAHILASRTVPDHLKTWTPLVTRGFELMNELNAKYIMPFDNMICMGDFDAKSDKELKIELLGLQPKYEELQSVATQLKSSVRSTQTK